MTEKQCRKIAKSITKKAINQAGLGLHWQLLKKRVRGSIYDEAAVELLKGVTDLSNGTLSSPKQNLGS